MAKIGSEKNSRMAAMMKERKITRKMGRCGLCDRMAPLPLDRHLATCRGPKRKSVR